MINQFLMPGAIVVLVLLAPQAAIAQVFVVESDDANFMDVTTVVGAAKRGSEIYVLEEKDGWLKAVEPKSQSPAWVNRSKAKLKAFTKAELAKEARLWEQMTTIEKYVNAGSATEAQLQEALTCSKGLRRIWGDKHPHAAVAMQYSGLVASNAGALAQAEELLTQALNIHLSVYGKSSPKTADVYLDLADVALLTGELKTAVEYAQNAWRINRDVLGPEHPDAIKAMVPAARAMESIEDYEDALGKYRIVHRIWLSHYGENDFRTLQIVAKIANMLGRLGRKSESIPMYEDVIEVLQTRHPEQSKFIALTQARLASLRMDASDANSIQAYRDAVDTIQKQFPEVAENLRQEERQLVHTLLSQGDTQGGFQIIDETLRRLGRSIRREFWGMTAEQQRDYLMSADGYSYFKAVALAIDFASDVDVVDLSSEWLTNGKGLVQEAQSLQAGALLDLKKRDAWASEPYVQLAEIQETLPDGAVFVDLLRYLDFELGDNQELKDAGYSYAAWVTKKQGHVQLVDLGSAELIDTAIRELRASLTNSLAEIRASGHEGAYQALLPKLQTVSRLVWQPIVHASDNADTLMVSPDHLTWLLPWAALLNVDGTFAVESCQIQLELSGREFSRPAQPRSRNRSVIFADPAYDSTVSDRSPDQTRSIDIAAIEFGENLKLPAVGQLKTSAQEAMFIAPSIEKLTTSAPEMLLEEQALESNFKELHGPEILVLSTHGFSLNGIESSEPDQAESTRGLSTDTAAITTMLDNPLLKCGLMLSGSNHHQSIVRLENDGVLTGVEIAGTDLQGTQLAVLSACETGLGDLEAAGGVVGLRRAFHVAGARSVLASLWSVEDRNTALLIGNLFRSLTETSDVRSALRQAQIQHIQTHRDRFGVAHPFYWAAFTLTGGAQF